MILKIITLSSVNSANDFLTIVVAVSCNNLIEYNGSSADKCIK